MNHNIMFLKLSELNKMQFIIDQLMQQIFVG
jgi:hypothetical protein